MSQLFFTSDTHFGHQKVIELSHRPFASVEEMDEELIRRWNSIIPWNGTVYHLGDVSFHKSQPTHAILSRLNGRKHLIMGNHDTGLNSAALSEFATVAPYYELSFDQNKIVLCHYPLESWNRMGHGSWHLHGHSHGNMASFGRRIDVGVDCWDQAPVSYEQLKEVFHERPIEARDHHGAPFNKPVRTP